MGFGLKNVQNDHVSVFANDNFKETLTVAASLEYMLEMKKDVLAVITLTYHTRHNYCSEGETLLQPQIFAKVALSIVLIYILPI